VDLSNYRGYFLEAITVATAPGSSTVIAVAHKPGEHVVLTLTQVVHVIMDSPGDWSDFIDETSVRRLPRSGSWPPEVHHLLQHHNNDTDLVWIMLIGPTQIEIVAETLATERSTHVSSRPLSEEQRLTNALICRDGRLRGSRLHTGCMTEPDTPKAGWVHSFPASSPDKDGFSRIVDADGGRDDAENPYYEEAAILPSFA
jgi:hypothetical protein